MGNLLLVWDRMGDYHRARVKALKEAMPGVAVFTADLGDADNLYQWNNTAAENHFCLSSKPAHQFDFRRVSRFVRLVAREKIGVVCIAGYGRAEYLLFLAYAKLSGLKVILFAESWYPSFPPFDALKSFFLRLLCDSFLVSGVRARNHFEQRLGIHSSHVRIGYSVVDNLHFARTEQSAPRKKVALCVARFSKEKNLELLVDAFQKSNMPAAGWELCLVGGGPGKDKLDQKVTASKNIRLLGWQPYDRLPELYHEASLFILPSLFEPWGLVVNEAMAASLPVIASDQVGCLPDLVTTENGWSFIATDGDDLANVLNNIAAIDMHELAKMGRKSVERIDAYSPACFASQLKFLVQQA